LMACESLQIDRFAIPLFCCGRTDKSSPIVEICRPYFSEIFFPSPSNGKFYAHAFSDDIKNRYFTLLSI
ncbi:MAG: hypothetical protein RMJ53_10840, partial [Chitinophagales bacterium]|nr:hypothetical protein [Chitinophagales bacterium]